MATSKKPYIGSRDFYPTEMRMRNWMFGVQRRVCERYGYEEYAAPLLEPLELYRLKSSDEIVNDQLYRFVDRGDREVAIRPEMTPTLARMASARMAELAPPLRWFSIANFMRYERPGRGRLREFYQLNLDLLGASGSSADAEVLMLAVDILRGYGADQSMFRVRYSDRRLLEGCLESVPPDARRDVARLLDKREKIGDTAFESELAALVPDQSTAAGLRAFLSMRAEDLATADNPVGAELARTRSLCEELGYGPYLDFDPSIVRGFDYYTGFVFEIFDQHPENRRSIFGGGRYDRLLGLFGKQEVPAVGFGLGDVTLQNFLEVHNLVSGDLDERRGAFVVLFGDELESAALGLAQSLREAGIETELALESTKKLGKQFELADRKRRRFVLILGPEEVQKGIVRVKDLATGDQSDVPKEQVPHHLAAAVG